MTKFNLVQCLLTFAMVTGGIPALAHGAKIQSQMVEAIALRANYDSGEPMAEAQVLIYAPDNPKEPWLTGTTDKNGKFLFTPEGAPGSGSLRDRPGNWEVVIRQAGHGAMVTVPVEMTTAPPDGEEAKEHANAVGNQTAIASANMATAELSPTAQWISMAAVIWGFIGTAFFFSKTKGNA